MRTAKTMGVVRLYGRDIYRAPIIHYVINMLSTPLPSQRSIVSTIFHMYRQKGQVAIKERPYYPPLSYSPGNLCVHCSRHCCRRIAAPDPAHSVRFRPSVFWRWSRATFPWRNPSPRKWLYLISSISFIMYIQVDGRIRLSSYPPQHSWNPYACC